MILRKQKLAPEKTPHYLSLAVIWFALPATVFVNIHALFSMGPIPRNYAMAVAMPWALFILATVCILVLSRIFLWDVQTTGALILTTGLGNTSFVGYPFIEALYGPSAMPVAVLIDQAGSFLVLSTLGLFTALRFSNQETSVLHFVKRIFSFPPFLALIAGVIFSKTPIQSETQWALKVLSWFLVPCALISVGMLIQIQGFKNSSIFKSLCIGEALKLILFPLVFSFILIAMAKSRGEWLEVTIIQSAMPPMITAAILATTQELNPQLANQMAGIGILISFFTIPCWSVLLHWFLGVLG